MQVKQISDNEIYLLNKYIKSVLWRVVKRLSYIQDARCLKVKIKQNQYSYCSKNCIMLPPHNVTVAQCKPLHVYKALHYAAPYMCMKHFIMLPPYMCTKHFIMLPPYMCTNTIGFENLFLLLSFNLKVDIKCFSNFPTVFP